MAITIPYIPDDEYEVLAEKLLSENGLLEIPVDITGLVKCLNLKLMRSEFDGEHISGMLVIDEKNPTVVVNGEQSEARQRFTIAHEIAHYELHRDREELFIDDTFAIALRSNIQNNENSRIMEIQANKMAAALLMPYELLVSELGNELEDVELELDDNVLDAVISNLASEFEVSEQAMRIRLTNLDLI